MESYVVTGSVVPIASLLMIRLELDNGAPDKMRFRVNLLSFY